MAAHTNPQSRPFTYSPQIRQPPQTLARIIIVLSFVCIALSSMSGHTSIPGLKNAGWIESTNVSVGVWGNCQRDGSYCDTIWKQIVIQVGGETNEICKFKKVFNTH